jgi:hypothetical protein
MIDIEQIVNDEAVCGRCGKRVVTRRVARYEHDDCEERGDDTSRRREAIRRLHRDTAALLRRIGHPEEAAYHDLEASRG